MRDVQVHLAAARLLRLAGAVDPGSFAEQFRNYREFHVRKTQITVDSLGFAERNVVAFPPRPKRSKKSGCE